MINFIEAIYKLNPSVVTIRGEDAFDANDNKIEYDKNLVQAYINSYQNELDAKAAQKAAILERLGLTEEELKVVLS